MKKNSESTPVPASVEPTSIEELPTDLAAAFTSAVELISLSALRVGEVGIVEFVSGIDHQLCSKLASMGMVSGTKVAVVAIAPLGDPMKVDALGYRLSLRRSEAESVRVKRSA